MSDDVNSQMSKTGYTEPKETFYGPDLRLLMPNEVLQTGEPDDRLAGANELFLVESKTAEMIVAKNRAKMLKAQLRSLANDDIKRDNLIRLQTCPPLPSLSGLN